MPQRGDAMKFTFGKWKDSENGRECALTAQTA